jgi:hypothetical protein
LGKSSDPFVADMFKEYGGESKFCTMVVRW